MKNIVLLILFLWGIQLLPAQIVTNGDFETITNYPTSCPTENTHQKGELKDFLGNWYMPTNGTSDFHCLSEVYTAFTQQDANFEHISCATGFNNGMVGLYTYFRWNGVSGCIDPATDYREYIQTEISLLEAGKTYHVRFVVRNSPVVTAILNPPLDPVAANGMGAYFSSTPYQHCASGDPCPVPAPPTSCDGTSVDISNNILREVDGSLLTPQISYSGSPIGQSCVLISGCFVAAGTEKYLTIGNFKDDAGTDISKSTNTNVAAYYFIEDVEVTKVGDNCPVPNFTAPTSCAGDEVTFTNTSTGGDANNQYTWDFGDGSPLLSGETPTHIYAEAGSYQVTLYAYNLQNGCEAVSETKQVTVLASPGSGFTASNTFEGLPVQFTPEDQSLTSYSWNFGDGGSSTASSPTHTYSAAGDYMVSLTVENSDNCQSTTVVLVTIREYTCPGSNFSFTTSCTDGFTSFTDGSSGNLEGATYTWDFGDGSSVVQSRNASHQYTTAGNYDVIHTVTGQSGCTQSSVTKTVTIHPAGECTETIACEDCIGTFQPLLTGEYVLSAWVKEKTPTPVLSYAHPNIVLKFFGTTEVYTFFPQSENKIIDGWQRIEETFTVPGGASHIDIEMNNSGPNQVFFDDIRIHPKNGNMKSFVYDPVTLRLVAELDENNYATIYEYDQEGALRAVKKETETQGVVTIQTSENATVKRDILNQ